MGPCAAVERNLDPLVESFRPIAAIAILPLVILWLGSGNLAAVAIVAYAAFFPSRSINTVAGVKRIEPSFLRAARTMGVPPLTRLRTVVLPAALPSILVGMRIGLGIAWTAIIAAELAVGAKAGELGRDRPDDVRVLRLLDPAHGIVVCMVAVGLVAMLLDRSPARACSPAPFPGAAHERRRSSASKPSARSFGEGDKTFVALEDLTLDVRPGEFLAIVGPVGLGQDHRAQHARRPRHGRRRARSSSTDRRIVGPGPERGVMFQDYALFPWRTVRGNIEFGLVHGPAGNGLDRAATRRAGSSG